MGKFEATHIPYKGAAPALVDTMSGQVEAFFPTIISGLPQVKSGKVRAIAVTTKERSPLLPNVPTVAEQGFPGYEVNGWYGLLAPAATPKEGPFVPACGSREGAPPAGHQGAHGGRRRSARRQYARAVRGLHALGDDEVGESRAAIRRNRGREVKTTSGVGWPPFRVKRAYGLNSAARVGTSRGRRSTTPAGCSARERPCPISRFPRAETRRIRQACSPRLPRRIRAAFVSRPDARALCAARRSGG